MEHSTSRRTARTSANLREMAVAAAIAILGLYMVWEGRSYGIGSVREMGPGYFPVALGCVLTVLGAGLVLAGRGEQRQESFRLKPLLCIVGAMIAFGYLMPRTGFVPATIALVLLSVLADKGFRLWEVAVLLVVLPVLGYVIFVAVLGMPLDAVRWGA